MKEVYGMRKDLIKVSYEGNKVVSAKELFESQKNNNCKWDEWTKKYILDNSIYKNTYIILRKGIASDNSVIDYALTIEHAEHIIEKTNITPNTSWKPRHKGKKIFKIYCHINIKNNKKYYGQTHLNFETRWKNGRGYEHQSFYKAIKKYGWNNFTHEKLMVGLYEDEADFWERYYIARDNTVNNGYNVAWGGKYYNHKNKKQTHGSLIAFTDDRTYCFRFKNTEEARQQLKDKFNINIKKQKIIYCCREERYNQRSAGKIFNKPLRWRYEKDYEELEKNNFKLPDKKYTRKGIRVFTKSGSYNKVFTGIKAIRKEFKADKNCIMARCQGVNTEKGIGEYQGEKLYCEYNLVEHNIKK